MNDRIKTIINFLKEIEKFKYIEREIYLNHRKESDAEHAWHLAMFLVLFEKDLPCNLNKEKMIKMALIHDLVEIYAGDTFFFDEEGRKGKKERELKAAKKLFAQLPEDLENEFHGLFNEFENSETKEAKIVQSFDKIQPIIQNICSGGKSWIKHDINYEKLDENKRKYAEHDEKIMEIYNKVMEEVKKIID